MDIKASRFAVELAEQNNIDISLIQGTGYDGNVTKADVEDYISREVEAGRRERGEAPQTDFRLETSEGATAAQSAALGEAENQEDASVDVGLEPETAPEIVTDVSDPDIKAVLEQMRSMQEELTALRAEQQRWVEREELQKDIMDDLFFLAKPNGNKWEERVVRDKRVTMVEMTGTAFYGPFEDRDQVDEYLAAKARKREDNHFLWTGLTLMTGREARALDRQEDDARRAQFDRNTSTNVLDQKIFVSQTKRKQGPKGAVVDGTYDRGGVSDDEMRRLNALKHTSEQY